MKKYYIFKNHYGGLFRVEIMEIFSHDWNETGGSYYWSYANSEKTHLIPMKQSSNTLIDTENCCEFIAKQTSSTCVGSGNTV